MKFFIQNNELDEKVRDIRRKIRNSMNGMVSDAMTKRGIIYKINYGVEIPRLREISKEYAQNHDLAQRLWAMKIRETMILATLLQPVDKLTVEIAENWLADITQPELAEQVTMNLFAKTPHANELALRWIQSSELWHQITGYMLVTRIWKELTDNDFSVVSEQALQTAKTDELMLYKSIAQALGRLCRRSEASAQSILQKVNGFKNSTLISEQYIYNEIQNEISFLNF